MKVLYTRNYQRREERESPKPPEVQINNAAIPTQAVPDGYSGTAMLREKEESKLPPSLQEESPSVITDNIQPPPLRTRKFKVKAKITPSLLEQKSTSFEQGDSSSDEEFNYDDEGCNDKSPAANAVFEAETRGCRKKEGEKDCDKKHEKDCDRLQNSVSQTPHHVKKHLFHRTPNRNNDDKRFSLDDLLLGGLILLLLNEGADDGMILIFGYLLFSSF